MIVVLPVGSVDVVILTMKPWAAMISAGTSAATELTKGSGSSGLGVVALSAAPSSRHALRGLAFLPTIRP
jgi:hypothetical protein